ncbi:MAG: ATP-dependent helicase [Alphaproteobacteria bacterium]
MALAMISLTEEQKVAVNEPGNVFLTACPGSGKTRAITAKILRELESVRGTPRRLACITYTNAAVYEIRSRLGELISAEDQTYVDICTIHSFCLNFILRPFQYKIPALDGDFQVLTQEMDEFQEIVRHVLGHEPDGRDFEDFSMLGRDADGNPIGSAKSNEKVAAHAKAFWHICEQSGYVDFSSIIYYGYVILASNNEVSRGLAARYRWILVDEFQDTSQLQVEILLAIFAEGLTNFFLVGDLYQSIYGFADARPDLAERFSKSIQARTDLSLTENFRSGPPIIEHAERLFHREPPMRSGGNALGYGETPIFCPATDASEAILQNFIPALAAREIEFGRSAILAPAWYMLLPVAKRLRENGISVIGPGARPYKRDRLFARLAESICGFLYDPMMHQMRSLEWSLFNTLLEVTAKPRYDIFSYQGRIVIAKMLSKAENQAENTDSAVTWLDEVSTSIGAILADEGLIPRAHQALFFNSVQDMKADIIKNSRSDPASLSIQELGILASPKNSIRLSSLHVAKGREFDAVAIIGLREGALPHWSAETDDEIDETKRLFYVGVTRARKFLMYVSDGKKQTDCPTRFLGRDGVGVL